MKRQLSQILEENAGLSEEDFLEALEVATEKGGSIGEILIRRKLITEQQLVEALGVQYDIPFMESLPLESMGSGITDRVPIQFLKKYFMSPLKRNH